MFYNGTDAEPECYTLHLSDLYTKREEHPELELTVRMLNINYGMNQDILQQCKMLLDYAKYVDRIRKYAILVPIEEAVEQAITECINEGILTELLTKYRREVVQVSIFEYDAEKEMKLFREAERGAGYAEGLKTGIETGREEGRLIGQKEGIQQGREEGALHQLFQLVKESLISPTVAAEKAGMTEEAFLKKMQETKY